MYNGDYYNSISVSSQSGRIIPMKKPYLSLPVVLTCLFLMFTLGFFLGKNSKHETVHLSVLPTDASHNTALMPASPAESPSDPVVFPVDINLADAHQLSALPGIGETISERILAYRELNGPFERSEELLNVEGIGTVKLEALLDFITIGG
jgi:competence ComEA-like helix-hairpin-helix protein